MLNSGRAFAVPHAGVAELADARDSKSRALHWACGFDPHLQHQPNAGKVQRLRSRLRS